MSKAVYFAVISILFAIIQLFTPTAKAIYDPLSVSNNRFGIHLISATPDETSPAATLVNSTGGDWGYVTFLIERKGRDKAKWQTIFDDLRRRHLIPIVRLATEPKNAFWLRPNPGEETDWANFLDDLNWPIKNRYIVIYNEPNHAQEWGNSTDPADYAITLDQTITALKLKNPDFFVINAGLDASTPQKPPLYFEEAEFLKQMNQAVPGIFNKLDGWSSHSYPNPGFVGLPTDTGKGTVDTFDWEMLILRQLGLTKKLPIFITETGWKHSEGISPNRSYPSPEKVGEYLITAYDYAWNRSNIVAVSPFLLNYQEEPFVNFSFKKYTGTPQNPKILGLQYPEYHQQYYAIADIPKNAGRPIQLNSAKLVGGIVYPAIVPGESYRIHLDFLNNGQSIWNDQTSLSLRFLDGEKTLSAKVEASGSDKVEPGQIKTLYINLTAPENGGSFNLALNLYSGDNPFDSQALSFKTEVKSPVSLTVKSNLKWKSNSAGEYFLNVASSMGITLKNILLDNSGQSAQIQDKKLLPDQEYDFTIKKDFYQPKTIRRSVHSGNNLLDFGTLEPNISSALLNPGALWQLLPFSN